MTIPKWKRPLDIALLVASAPVWLPVGMSMAIWIKIVSRGPLFFRQERVGLGGEVFRMWKFRSMAPDALTRSHEEHWENLMRNDVPMTKLDGGDGRLIAGARVFRALGLDELPQLVNVLRGEMSFVGPRPSTVSEFSRFDDRVRRRADILPGVTGWWQVNGKNRRTFREMIALDLEYQERMSPWMDLAILARTPAALFSQWRESRASGTRAQNHA